MHLGGELHTPNKYNDIKENECRHSNCGGIPVAMGTTVVCA